MKESKKDLLTDGNGSFSIRRFGWPFRAVALLAFSVLVALAVPTRSLAQAPTFNTLITTYKGDPGFAHPAWAAVGDFNGDGKLDSAVTDGTGTVHMLLGNGDGTFSERRIDVGLITAANAVDLPASFATALPHVIDGVKSIRAVDVNGDGKLDLVLVMGVHLNFAPLGGVTVMINTGNDASGVPQFTTSAHYFAPNFDNRSLTVGDLNGDGRPDFIAGNANSPIWTWLNNGNGTFTFKSTTSFMPNAGNPAVNDGVIADVNGDGKADFVVTSGQGGATDIFLGNGDGTFQAPIVIPGATSVVAVADLNKDGIPDLILNPAGVAVSVALGIGHGAFAAPVVYSTGVAGGVVTSLAVADINGDGKLDVVAGVTLGVPGKVAIFLGDGSGALGTPYVFNANSQALAVVAADFTGDGKPDIGTVGFWDDTYGVLTNTTVSAPAQTPTTTTVSFGTGPFVYSGSAFTATASVSPAVSGSATIVYSGDCINAGNTCSATATYAGDATHLGSSGTATITINKATSSTVVACPTSVTYTGTAQTPCTAAVTGAGGLNQSLTVTYSNNTNAGTATANASYPGDANHAGSSASANFAITYAFGGFLQPIPLPVSTFKAGSTIPVKFVVANASGVPVSTAVANVSVNGGPSLGTARFTDGHYQFNLQTKGLAVGALTITVTLDDGTSHSVTVTLK